MKYVGTVWSFPTQLALFIVLSVLVSAREAEKLDVSKFRGSDSTLGFRWHLPLPETVQQLVRGTGVASTNLIYVLRDGFSAIFHRNRQYFSLIWT